MEELAYRFPHLCENVFKSLDDGNIAAFRKVGRSWGKFLDKQKFVKIRIIKATVGQFHRIGETWNQMFQTANTETIANLQNSVGEFYQQNNYL